MKKLIIALTALVFIMCSSGQKNNPDKSTDGKNSNDSLLPENKMPDQAVLFQFDYLGETAPDSIPVVFAKDIVSTGVDESSFEINKQGDEVVFSRDGKIIIMKKNGSEWSQPTVAPFSGDGIDGECCFSPAGDRIYFASRRNLQGAKGSLNTWISEKKNGVWSDPYPLKSPFFEQTVHAVSVANSDNLYCSGINVFLKSDGGYSPSMQFNSGMKGSHPYIAPDESFIIFASIAPGRRDPDLFISCRTNQTWTSPASLNNKINTTSIESNPFVSPDGKYLFFIRKYDVYWVRFDLTEYQ